MTIRLKDKLYTLCTIHAVVADKQSFAASLQIIDSVSSDCTSTSQMFYQIPKKYEALVIQHLHSREPLLISIEGLNLIDSILCIKEADI